MRIYIISAAYPPEPITAAATARDIAEAMTQRGHEVTVFVPFPNRPAGKIMHGYRRSLRRVEYRDNYRIVYNWHILSKKATLSSRLAENLSFGITSSLQLMQEAPPDLAYINTWPIFAQWMNTIVLSDRKVPVVCAVKDMYPETLASNGKISKRNPIDRLIKGIGTQVYRKSAVIAPLNSSMRDQIVGDRHIPAERVQVLRDWIDGSRFPMHQPRNGRFREMHKLPSELFLAMYVGSMTHMARLDLYIETAEHLQHRKDIRILLVGDGAMREKIEAVIRQKGLDNIQLIWPLKPEDVADVQAAADVLTLSLMQGPAEHATPSKLIFYMFSQRPIVASLPTGSPAARMIEDAKCGYVVNQGDPKGLAKALEKMADDRASLLQLGENSRSYAEEHFSKDTILPQLCNMFEQIANRSHDGEALNRTQAIQFER